uniref:Uncharacterized protein n=1 Tax=Graphocephala atropunctata TaxID=36148 RepID=A0A1B6LLH8_9HEMI
MELLPSAWVLLYFCVTLYSVISVKSESWIGMSKNSLKETSGSRLPQHLQNVRHKRDVCTGECGCQDPTRGSQVNKPHPQRNVVAYHYHHHYYYCCPAAADSHRSQAAHRKQPQAHKHPTSTVDCACNVSGSCSCTLQDKCSVDSCGQNQNPNQNAAFGFGMVVNDPVEKEFFEFITKNFIKKEAPGQKNNCQGNFGSNNLEDPVCREFFNFFSQNFVRRPEQKTAPPPPTPPPTLAPTQAQHGQGAHFQGSIHEFNDMKTMFDTLQHEMKDTISKTADMAKKMGLPILR